MKASLLDEVSDAVVGVDAQGKLTVWNRGAEGVLGWSSGEAVGRTLARLLKPEAHTWTAARRSLQKTGRWQGEMSLVHRTGFRLTMQARWVQDGDTAWGVHTDVTQRQLTEGHLDRLRRLESLASVATGLAHDLNNILSPILMSSGLLQTFLQDPEDRELAAIIEKSGQRGAALVREVQTFARALPAPRTPTPLEVVAGQVVRTCRQRFPATIQIHALLPEQAPEILSDPVQLHQLLWDQLQLAREALPDEGTIEVSVASTPLELTLELTASPAGGLPGGPRDLGAATVQSMGGTADPWRLLGDKLVRSLRWPVAQAAAPVLERPALGRGQAILVCYEPPLTELVGRTLTNWGYRVVGSAGEAVAALGSDEALADLEPYLVRVQLPRPFGVFDLLSALERALR